MEKRGRSLYIFIMLIVVIIVFFLLILNVPYFSTFAIEGGEEGGGASSDTASIILAPGEITYADPNVNIEVSTADDDATHYIVFGKPKQQTSVVLAGQFVEFRIPFEIPEISDKKIDQVRVTLPPGSKYVSVLGDKPTSVSVRVISLTNDPFPGNDNTGLVELAVFEPAEGDYEVSFFTPGAFVSSEKFILNGRGKEIVVSNNDISYSDVNIVVSLNGLFIFDDNGLEVKSKTGQILPYSAFDVDKNGVYDFVKFKVNSFAGAQDAYQIIRLSEEEIPEVETPEIPVEVNYQDLTVECKQNLACASKSVCIYEGTTDAFTLVSPISGVKDSLCISENPNCPPIARKIDTCSFRKDIRITPRIKPPIYSDIPDSEINTFSIEDSSSEESVGTIVIVDDQVNIIFSQTEDEEQLSPPACFNSILDEGEQRIDCGGLCEKECLVEVKSYKFIISIILWLVFGILLLAFIFYNRIFRAKKIV